ncbi:hypothetical protein MKX01_013552 [Papaver californicum]|nr:hypothetical protein MKX01_013552 [Papaver californicum]
MGNAMALCFYVNCKASTTSSSSSSLVKLIFWQGKTITFKGKKIAGEIIDELSVGQTYFILPIDPFAFKVLSISSLSSLASSSSRGSSKPKKPTNFAECPFQYVRGSDGRMLIRVLPEFIMQLITASGQDGNTTVSSSSCLCQFSQLKKHYDVLVGFSKERVWSPKLETISKCKKNVGITTRLSPCRLLGIDVRRSTVRLINSN